MAAALGIRSRKAATEGARRLVSVAWALVMVVFLSGDSALRAAGAEPLSRASGFVFVPDDCSGWRGEMALAPGGKRRMFGVR
jgi:hypothetical protein